MSLLQPWQEKAAKKRTSLYDLIPQEWRLPKSIINNPPKNSTIVPSQCGILSKLDLEITEIDNIEELAHRIAQGKYSAVQVIEAYCKRAAIAHQLVNCLAEILFTQALERAQYLDDYFKSTGGKTVGPFHGIPISFKDQFNIKGIETAMAYIGYLGDIAEHNSILVDIVLSLGAVLYVKTALPQTIMLPETRSHLLGITLNPLNRELSCGGSSGGEGSLIAMKGSICGLGTDIGGSIRFPTALNGIYGLKPSDGRIPYGRARNSFDGQESVPSVIGPMTRSLSNIRLFFKSILETKPWLIDPQVHNIPWREDLFQEGQMNKLSFGVIQFDQKVHLSPPVQRAINMSINALEKVGHQVIQWDTIDHPEGIDILVKMYQADGGKDVQKALDLSGESIVPGAFVGKPETEISIYEYWQLNVARRDYAMKYLEKWNKTKEITSTGRPIDGIISPICGLPAYPHEYQISIEYTGIVNLLQLTSIILPITRVDSQLDQITDEYRNMKIASDLDKMAKETYKGPEVFENCIVGLQIICRRLEEEKAIGMAMVLEKALELYQ
ncbi:unnamed protein product [Rotaria sordida]|uniref:amidase n=1 Tax=Rotaria sordida TaxID=392033 RepID=A0A814TC85_9BILA|nr:unnamed protein product [Rotaria sordida]CAF1165642.1 unnamed protein product [Rotaria sordida]CAF3664931.1 unnamed protein product [Rotaria sordida]CAF3769379.1 unnamed protein product [Rotaria sordida]